MISDELQGFSMRNSDMSTLYEPTDVVTTHEQRHNLVV